MAITVNGVQVAGNGKSAYLYALAGGYTGTEEQFIKDLGRLSNTPVYIQLEQPDDINCFWIKAVDPSVVNLILQDQIDKYMVQYDNTTKGIKNAVDSEEDLKEGKYAFTLE